MSELKVGTKVRVNHLKRIGYVKEICHNLKAEGVLYLVELDNITSCMVYKEDVTVESQPKENNMNIRTKEEQLEQLEQTITDAINSMKTKEELEKVIAEATAALAELDKVTPWTPKGSRWLVSPTKEVDDVGGFICPEMKLGRGMEEFRALILRYAMIRGCS